MKTIALTLMLVFMVAPAFAAKAKKAKAVVVKEEVLANKNFKKCGKAIVPISYKCPKAK